jgi:hypothetical protein
VAAAVDDAAVGTGGPDAATSDDDGAQLSSVGSLCAIRRLQLALCFRCSLR